MVRQGPRDLPDVARPVIVRAMQDWNRMLAGRFLVFDGPDGSGKSTQLRRFADHAIHAWYLVTLLLHLGLGLPTDADALEEMQWW